MSTQKEQQIIRIDLTQEQKDKVKATTGKTADTIEFTVQELEERINPGIDLGNHNETFLLD
jgi:hypothetical protein